MAREVCDCLAFLDGVEGAEVEEAGGVGRFGGIVGGRTAGRGAIGTAEMSRAAYRYIMGILEAHGFGLVFQVKKFSIEEKLHLRSIQSEATALLNPPHWPSHCGMGGACRGALILDFACPPLLMCPAALPRIGSQQTRSRRGEASERRAPFRPLAAAPCLFV